MRPYFERDGIVIYHARCEDVLPSIDPASVDLLLTDPPYGVDYVAPAASGLAGASKTGGQHVMNDADPFDPSALLTYARVVLFGGDRYSASLPVGGWVVWDKTGGNKARTFMADAEMAWTNLTQSVDVFHHLWLGAFRDSEPRLRGVHPTQKPTALMRWIVDRFTDPDDLVLDPYMGSGPVAQACHELGRRYIGCEVVEDYCRVAVTRLRQGVLNFDGGDAA